MTLWKEKILLIMNIAVAIGAYHFIGWIGFAVVSLYALLTGCWEIVVQLDAIRDVIIRNEGQRSLS